jgi:hypothetical protein
MARAERSGIIVHPVDVPLILAMVARGDRRHDIAAWFGLNQGRIAEVEEGRHGRPAHAPLTQLPPSGSPGPKAMELRRSVGETMEILRNQGANGIELALDRLVQATAQFDRNEPEFPG